jgi:putative endonuclease
MPYTVYILRTSQNTLYTGQTNNLENRLREHSDKKGNGSKYLRAFPSFTLVYKEVYSSRKEAMQREWQLKKWTKAKKEKLISGDLKKL